MQCNSDDNWRCFIWWSHSFLVRLHLRLQVQSQNQPDVALLSSDPRPVDCSLAFALLARFLANGNHINCPSREFLQAQRSTTGKQKAREIKSKENRELFFFWGTWGASGHSKLLLLHHHGTTKKWRCISHSTAIVIQPPGKFTLSHRTKRYLLRAQKQRKTYTTNPFPKRRRKNWSSEFVSVTCCCRRCNPVAIATWTDIAESSHP
jgi:hypothetical protein